MTTTQPREYQIPVIIDVTAYSIEDACAGAVEALVQGRLPGRWFDAGNGTGRSCIESWWTVEGVAKPFDGNDNDNGVVVFADDLDYLHRLLKTTLAAPHGDAERHARLTAYFAPSGRCGSNDLEAV